MSRARLLLSESWASIRQNLSTTVAATMTVLIGMCLLGLFIALGTWVLSWSDHVQKELTVHVYFTSGATQQQEAFVRHQLLANKQVKTVTFVSKAEAEAQMRRDFPNLYVAPLPSNPLPDSYVAVPMHPNETPALGKAVRSAGWPAVETVSWGNGTAKTVITVAKVISIVFLVAVVLLVIASALLIANTIRLSIFARRREIEVMKLVGATNWFIRGPFMLEGLLVGLAGSALAVLLLLLGKEVALPTIIEHLGGGTPDVHAFPFMLNALVLFVAGLLLGAAGSGLTIRRFLQV
ncbi:MAG: cell division transport system permease protein [Gaiellaceae bacterium]|jgi:cell division transport system permease protein|nr:cell division transport system permease protein [Gaiellaceae bacterium]